MKIEFESAEDLATNLVKYGYKGGNAEKIAKALFGEDVENTNEDNTKPSFQEPIKQSFEEFTKSLDKAIADGVIDLNDAARAESAYRLRDKKTLNEILEKMESKSE